MKKIGKSERILPTAWIAPKIPLIYPNDLISC